MKVKLNLNNIFVNKIININKKSWKYLKKGNIDESLCFNQQYAFYENMYKLFLVDNIIISQKKIEQQILNECIENLDSNINYSFLNDKNYFLYFDISPDTNEVVSFKGYIKTKNNLNIQSIFKHIDSVFKNKNIDMQIILEYCNKENNESIEIDVNYQNEGLIHLNLDKYGCFNGETLFLLKGESFNYQIDFINKIDNLYHYLSHICQK